MGRRFVKKKREAFGLGSFLVLAVALLLVVWLVITSNDDPGKQEASVPTPVATTNSAASRIGLHTEEEAIRFLGESDIQKVLGLLIAGEYPLKQIQRHFNDLLVEVRRLYKKDLQIAWRTMYNSNRSVAGAASLEAGVPLIQISIPSAMDVYLSNAGHPKQLQRLEVNQVSIFLHEMEHLALGHVLNPAADGAFVLQHEVDAFAETCSKVISVFVKEGYSLDSNAEEYYSRWVGCGSAKNSCWSEAVKSIYMNSLRR